MSAARTYTLRCPCGFEKRHQGRPPRLCPKCGADRETAARRAGPSKPAVLTNILPEPPEAA